MDDEFTGLLIAVLGVIFMIVLPALAGIYLWVAGYTTAVIIEGIIWLFILGILRDWLRGDD